MNNLNLKSTTYLRHQQISQHNVFMLLRIQLKTILFLSIIILFSSRIFATDYYSRTTSGVWNNSSSWSTVTYGNATNTGTFPRSGDRVFIDDGNQITITSNSVCSYLEVGRGISGILSYSDFSTYTLTVAGNVLVNTGAILNYAGNRSRAHRLFISRNLTNDGTIDLYADANDVVNLTFNSSINSIVSGSGTFDLNQVSLFKSSNPLISLNITSTLFETGIRTLQVAYGVYIHNNSTTYTVNPSAGAYIITTNATFSVPQGVLNFSSTANDLFLQGKLIVNGGIVNIGQNAGTGGIRYRRISTNTPELRVTSGTLNVMGGITTQSGYTNDPLSFIMSGGTINLNIGVTGTASENFKITNHASSNFTMSSGNIIIQRSTRGGSAISDFDICGSSGTVNVTGGTIQFGNASSPASHTFKFTPYPNATLPNIRISGTLAAVIRLRPIANSTANCNMLSLNIETNKIFDIRSITGTTGDTRVLRLSDDFDGINTFMNNGQFIARNSTLLIQSNEGLWLSGSTTTTFYNFEINNPFGVNINLIINVSNQLNLVDGIVFTYPINQIRCLNTATANIGSNSAYIDGPYTKFVATASVQNINMPIGKNGAYRPMLLSVQHTNATSVIYTSEVLNMSARAMNYSLPSSISWVSDVRHFYISRSNVSNLSSAQLTCSYGSDDVVTDYNNLCLARDNGSSAWLDIGGIATSNTSGNITSNSFNGFNTLFTLGNRFGGSNPLPVEWLNFEVSIVNKHNKLIWSTASEKNADYFEIQRANLNNEFIPVGRVSSAGNSTQISNYSFIEYYPASRDIYYRIKQVDIDGKFEYSEIKILKFQGINNGISIYPNPSISKVVNLQFNNEIENNSKVAIVDMTGKMVYKTIVQSISSGGLSLDLNHLSAGVYLLNFSNDNGFNQTSKLFLQ